MDNTIIEMNIYQKIAILQDVIKVNKDNNNKFAGFKYRTIQNILSELKPNLTKLGLVINFGGGSLREDIYSLNLRVIDTHNPNNRIEESSEIYIDRTKSKMDLSQKVLSAKTFLKKSMLEDLLLLSEDDDPDSHDNTDNNNQQYNNNKGSTSKPAPKPAPKPVSQESKDVARIKNILFYGTNQNQDKMIEVLKEVTAFEGKDGKVSGLTSFDKLSGKRLEIALKKVERLYPDAVKQVEAKSKKK